MTTPFTDKTFSETYRDSYDKNDGYHRLLFNSGRALQGRELIEMQTIIQEEIASFGRNIFKEGALVKPGGATIDNKIEFIKLSASSTLPTQSLVGSVYEDASTGLQFKILEVLIDEIGNDPITLFVKYLNSVTGENQSEPSRIGPEVVMTPEGGTTNPLTSASVDQSGRATRVYFDSGEFFVQGHFVYIEKCELLLSKYSSTPTNDIGFLVKEVIVTEGDDENLYDNQGEFPNYSSPGAHRYQIKLIPSIRPEGDSDENFVWVARIVEGKINREVKTSDSYNEINNLLALRTKEESGDYVVEEFKSIIEEKDENNLNLDVTEGVAYVDGYRLEIGQTDLPLPKARTTASKDLELVSADYGNWVYITENVDGLGRIDGFGQVEFQDGALRPIGTANLRGIERDAAGHRAYLFNIQMFYGETFSDAQSMIDVSTGERLRFPYTDSTLGGRIFGANHNNLLFSLPNKEPTKDSIDFATYTAQFNLRLTSDSTGNLATTGTEYASWIIANEAEGILPITSDNGSYTGLTPDTEHDLLIYREVTTRPRSKNLVTVDKTFSATEGQVEYFSPAEGYYFRYNQDRDRWFLVLNGQFQPLQGHPNYHSPVDLKPLGSTDPRWKPDAVSELEWNGVTYYVGPYDPSTSTPEDDIEKFYLLVDGVENNYDLGVADGVSLNSVTQTVGTETTDITFMFDFDGGQRDNFYDLAKLSLKPGNSIPDGAELNVNFSHFEHLNDGKFFAATSYTNVSYDEIPSHKLISGEVVPLRNVLDFRPTRLVDGSFDVNELPQNSSVVTIDDINYYLPRVDVLVANTVDRQGRRGIGELQLIQGNPSFNPVPPSIPTGSLPLYNYYVDAYTFDMNSVRSENIPHKRFTMKDIAALENRVNDLYELTTLSLLESNTNALTVVDSNGLQRTKAGFIADNFASFNFSDVNDPEYRASINFDRGEIKPSFREQSVRLKYNSTNGENTIVKKGDLVTLEHSNVNFISQTLATSTLNVNPFEVITQQGTLELSPASDEWVETNRLPDIMQTTVRREVTGDPNATRARLVFRTSRTIQEFVGERILDIEIIPFMRSRNISFRAQGLRPNTKVYPFFGNQLVEEWVRDEPYVLFSDSPNELGNEYKNATQHPDGPTDLVTDSFGAVTGSFFLPNTLNISFRTGTQQLKLLDININDDESATSITRANYTSTGTIETVQRTIRSTRVITEHWEEDPLAQTFFVDQIENPNGIFVPEVRIFMESKDETIPLQVQIRSVENGIPTIRSVPGGIKFLSPSQVNVTPYNESTDIADIQSNPTSVVFDEPVYLTSGQEYAIVLLAQSTEYNAYVAEIEEFVIGPASRQSRVTRQPAMGSLFKSQNGSTWTPDQTKDLMFEIDRAEFDTSGTLVLENATLPKVTLVPNPIQSTEGSLRVKVRHEGHGFSANDSVTLSDIVGSVGGIPVTELNGTHVVKSPTWEGYSIDVTTTATSSGTGGGNDVSATQQVMFDEFTPMVQSILPSSTSIATKIRAAEGTSYGATRSEDFTSVSYQMVESDANINTTTINTSPKVVATADNAAKSLEFALTFTTSDSKVSPLVDLQRVSVLALENVIAGPVADGKEAAQHITTPTVLDESSTGLKVIFAANRPKDAEFEVYVRTSIDEDGIQTASWRSDIVEAEANVPSDENPTVFRDYEYLVGGTEGTMTPFSTFQVKVVMRSTNSSRVPTIQDLRVIALAT